MYYIGPDGSNRRSCARLVVSSYARIRSSCAVRRGTSHGRGFATRRQYVLASQLPMPTWFRRRFTAPMSASWNRRTDGRASARPTITPGWTPLSLAAARPAVRRQRAGRRGAEPVRAHLSRGQRHQARAADHGSLRDRARGGRASRGRRALAPGPAARRSRRMDAGGRYHVRPQARSPSPRRSSLRKRFLGLPYTWGGTSSFGYDCSGFSQMLCRRRGLNMPRDAQPQADWSGVVAGERDRICSRATCCTSAARTKKITHTGIYMGDGKFINATTHETPMVRIDDLNDAVLDASSWWR